MKASDSGHGHLCVQSITGNHLNYGPAAKQSQLTAAMYYKDTAGIMDVTDPTLANVNANTGLLLSFVDMKAELNRHGTEFCLMASEDDASYSVKLTDVFLKIRKVKV